MKVSDLGIIAALRLSGIKEKSVDFSDIKRIAFIFDDIAQVVEIVDKFQDGSIVGPLKGYYDAVKSVKNYIYFIKDKYENPRHIYR